MGNAKRLAKNTLFMYIRMGILMLISLYTSRVLLKELGVSDYGVYNVVGSIVVMFGSLRGIFSSSTQRFLNVEMGKGNYDKLKTIFNMSVLINLIISVIFVLIVEAVGVWFLNYKINVDPSRLYAAKWVFQFSVFSAVISMMTTPFDAVIIANERMGFFAGMSIFEGVLKLAIIFLLPISPIDKLIFYGLLVLSAQIVVRLVNAIYCRRHFKESHYQLRWDKPLFKDMASFAGWNFFANTGYSLANEGVNMLLNVFGGTVVNAARGITYQIRYTLEHFIQNVTKATDPHAMKLYAQENTDKFYELMAFVSKILFSAYLCVAIPIFFYTEEILQLWLGQIPEYSPTFIRLILIHGLIRSYLHPFNTLFYSANKVKYYQIRSLIISLLLFIASYVALKLEMPYYTAFVVMVISMAVSWITVIIQSKVLCGMSIRWYIRAVALPTLLTFGISCGVCCALYYSIKVPGYSFIIMSCAFIMIAFGISVFMAFSKKDRKKVFSIIKK